MDLTLSNKIIKIANIYDKLNDNIFNINKILKEYSDNKDIDIFIAIDSILNKLLIILHKFKKYFNEIKKYYDTFKNSSAVHTALYIVKNKYILAYINILIEIINEYNTINNNIYITYNINIPDVYIDHNIL